MTVTAACIFLAIILAPALIEGGSIRWRCICYWGVLSSAPRCPGPCRRGDRGARPMLTGFTAMGSGAPISFPLFVLAPELTLQDGHVAVLPFIEAVQGRCSLRPACRDICPDSVRSRFRALRASLGSPVRIARGSWTTACCRTGMFAVDCPLP